MEFPWGTAKNPQAMEAEYNHLNLIARPRHMLISTPPKHLENAGFNNRYAYRVHIP
jgi:hypothetical protein